MKTGKLLIMSLLVAAFLGSCTNTEEPVTDGTGEAIEVNAGIAESTRAVISGVIRMTWKFRSPVWITPEQQVLNGIPRLSMRFAQVVQVTRF